VSNGSGNKEIENNQQAIQMVLTTRAIEFVTIDISAPGMQKMRSFMREKGKKREGQRNALPPQIFNGDEHRGDYEGFDIANEDDELEEFLGIPRKNPKAEPVKTGAVAPEVGKLNPGKLDKDNLGLKFKDTGLGKGDMSGESKKDGGTGDGGNLNANKATSDGKENLSDGDENISSLKIATDQDDTDSNDKDNEDESEYQKESFKDWKQSVEDEALQNAAIKISEKTDGLTGQARDKDAKEDMMKTIDDTDDSSDESSDEDTAVEYMPDGELVRKKSRGFKQLNNCKRFWKASLMVE